MWLPKCMLGKRLHKSAHLCCVHQRDSSQNVWDLGNPANTAQPQNLPWQHLSQLLEGLDTENIFAICWKMTRSVPQKHWQCVETLSISIIGEPPPRYRHQSWGSSADTGYAILAAVARSTLEWKPPILQTKNAGWPFWSWYPVAVTQHGAAEPTLCVSVICAPPLGQMVSSPETSHSWKTSCCAWSHASKSACCQWIYVSTHVLHQDWILTSGPDAYTRQRLLLTALQEAENKHKVLVQMWTKSPLFVLICVHKWSSPSYVFPISSSSSRNAPTIWQQQLNIELKQRHA